MIEEVAFIAQGEAGVNRDGLIDTDNKDVISFDSDYSDDYFNDQHVLYYGWVADCATTSHMSNQQEVFCFYQPTNGTTVAGFGNVKTVVEGCRTQTSFEV